MENQNEREDVYSKRVRAGKRTYFFDVKATRANDYFVTITESKRKFQEDGYIKHKLFLYKEDFNKFLNALNETIDYVKTDLLPDYNFEEFDRDQDDHNDTTYQNTTTATVTAAATETTTAESKITSEVETEEPVAELESSDMKWD